MDLEKMLRIFLAFAVYGLMAILGLMMALVLLALLLNARNSFSNSFKRRYVYKGFTELIHDFSGFEYDPADEDEARGLRFATLVFDKLEGLYFKSLVQDYHFRPKAVEAFCTRGFSHVPPADHCTCGFYSLRDFQKLKEATTAIIKPNSAVLEVRVFGGVIEGKNGLRSQHQIVEKVWLPMACSRSFCRCRAVRFVATFRNDNKIRTQLMPYCERHTPDGITFTVQDLRDGLKTEVEWGYAPG